MKAILLAGKRPMVARGVAGFESGMPGLGDVMSDDEIRDVLSCIRSIRPDRIRNIQARRSSEHAQ